MFLVHGKKRSHDYMIHIPFGDDNLKLVQATPGKTLLFPYTYNSVWRAMCRAGMSVAVTTRVNRIVTHRARYELADKLRELDERNSITPLLHHKSSKSKYHYVGVMGK